MRKTWEITNNPEQVNAVLTTLLRGQSLSKTFDGTVKNGHINGFFSNLALVNDIVIGYVKIRGEYNLEEGNLKIEVSPSNLFWIVEVLALLVVLFFVYKVELIPSILFLVMALVWIIFYLVESRSFVKQIRIISNENIDDEHA